MNKKTQELMEMLQTGSLPLDTYLQENREELLDLPLWQVLNQLLGEYAVTKGEVIRRSGLNPVYGYQIFAGTRAPGRNKLLALCFAFPLSLEKTQRLLRLGAVGELYPRRKRDCALIFGLQQGLTVLEMDDLLYSLGEETLL